MAYDACDHFNRQSAGNDLSDTDVVTRDMGNMIPTAFGHPRSINPSVASIWKCETNTLVYITDVAT